jgi:hypothetical protein
MLHPFSLTEMAAMAVVGLTLVLALWVLLLLLPEQPEYWMPPTGDPVDDSCSDGVHVALEQYLHDYEAEILPDDPA